MAMRLSFDLGLHIDCTPYLQEGKMSLGEAEARRTAFWGAFVVNQYASFLIAEYSILISLIVFTAFTQGGPSK